MSTNRVGLLGWPVGHSVSPAMHNAAFASLRLKDWRYEKLAVSPDNLESEIIRLVNEEDYRGFNATIPHKQAIIRLADDISPAARVIGAANTLIVKADGTIQADNTDWLGFAQDLQAAKVDIRGMNTMVLGTGGSSKAIIYALKYLGAAQIIQVSRNPTSHPDIIGYDQIGYYQPNLIINTTPVGMYPDIGKSPWPSDILFPAKAILVDLIYNPPLTQLMETARAAGATAMNGLSMLVRQGALAFEMWTGKLPPLDVMFIAAREALE